MDVLITLGPKTFKKPVPHTKHGHGPPIIAYGSVFFLPILKKKKDRPVEERLSVSLHIFFLNWRSNRVHVEVITL